MALDSFQRDFGLADKEQNTLDTLQGNIVSTFQAGTFFGALLSFPLAEKIGRKRSIMIASLVFLVGGSLMVCISYLSMPVADLYIDCGQRGSSYAHQRTSYRWSRHRQCLLDSPCLYC